MYDLILTGPASGYIVNKSTRKILCLVETKRPDLEFKELQNMIDKANEYDEYLVREDDLYYSQVLLDALDVMYDEDY